MCCTGRDMPFRCGLPGCRFFSGNGGNIHRSRKDGKPHQGKFDKKPLVDACLIGHLAFYRNIESRIKESERQPRRLLLVPFLQRIRQLYERRGRSALAYNQIPDMAAEAGNEIEGVETFRQNLVEEQQSPHMVPCLEKVNKTEIIIIVQHIQVGYDLFVRNIPSAKRHRLVEQSQSVPHRAVRLRGYHMQGLIPDFHAFLGRNAPQVAHYVLDSDPVEIVSLAP